jgi:5-methylcytosine-specific restriction endonuclease McrA
MVDHIHEIAEGGDPLAVSNLQTLCRSCHEKKSDRFSGKVYGYDQMQRKPVNGVQLHF